MAAACPLLGTVLQGPIGTANTARLFTGRIVISPSQQWTNAAGNTVAKVDVTVDVTAGTITAVDGVAQSSVNLEPNDTTLNPSSGTYYTFTFIGASPNRSYELKYSVPTSGSPVTLAGLNLLTVAGTPLYPYLSAGTLYTDPAWLVLTKLGSTISLVDGDIPGNLKRYANLQAAITGSATKHLWIPCGSYMSASVTISSAIRIEGASRDCVTITFSGSPDIGAYVTANNVEISGISFAGATGKAFYLYGVSQIRFHDNRVSGGGAVTTATLPLGGVWYQDADDVTIEKNEFTGNGPVSGSPVQNTHDIGGNFYIMRSAFSTRIRMNNNRFWANNTAVNVGVFNTSDSEANGNITDQNNATAGGSNDGYGIMFYGSGSRTMTSAARSSNVLTVVTSTPHLFWVGAHVIAKDSTPAGASYFDFDCVVSTVPDSTHFTCPQTGPDDTATGGVVNLSPQNISVQGNKIRNTAGTGIYMQSYTDYVVEANQMWNVAQQQSPVSLCAAGIGLQTPRRVRVFGNDVNGSTQDGICVASGESVAVGHNTVVSALNGINLRAYLRDCSFTTNTVEGGSYGFYEGSSTTVWRLAVEGNVLRFQTTAGVYMFGNTNDSQFSGNQILPWPAATYGILVGVQGGTGTNNVLISGNTLYGLYQGLRSMTTGGIATYGNRNLVSNNRISFTGGNSIVDNSTDSVFSGNFIFGSNTFALALNNSVRAQSLNNTMLSNISVPWTYSATTWASGNRRSVPIVIQ